MTKNFFKSIGWFWIMIVRVLVPQKDSRNLSLTIGNQQGILIYTLMSFNQMLIGIAWHLIE